MLLHLFKSMRRCLWGRKRECAALILLALWWSPLASGQPRNSSAAQEECTAVVFEELRQMRQLIQRLETRIAQLETQLPVGPPRHVNASGGTITTAITATPVASPLSAPPQSKAERQTLDFFRRVTINGTLDGYYSYNFNRPLGGINLLRAYDVTSNSFNLNQAALVLEQAPNVEAGQRFGMRLDLQFGQATETVQGNAANEPRPQVFRHVWQAYGTYVVPVGKGLTVDFGKFAGSLGYETNYTKDNFNYSRSYFFNYLPFYHFGLRAAYPVNDKLTATYWLVNGANQSEDFNGFKFQF